MNITDLNKFPVVCKKLLDSQVQASEELKSILIKYLYKVSKLIVDLNKSLTNLNDDIEVLLQSQDVIRNMINDISNATLINYLLLQTHKLKDYKIKPKLDENNDPIGSEVLSNTEDSSIRIVLSILNNLSQVEFIVWERMISIGYEYTEIYQNYIIECIKFKGNNPFLTRFLLFNLNYHIHYFESDNLRSYLLNEKNINESIEMLIELYISIDNEINPYSKLYSALLIITLCYDDNFYNRIIKLNIIKPICYYFQNLIETTYSKSNYNDNNSLKNKNVSKLSIKSAKSKQNNNSSINNRANINLNSQYQLLDSRKKQEDREYMVNALITHLSWMTNPILVSRTCYFKLYNRLLKCVLCFFYIYHNNFKFQTAQIFNYFSYAEVNKKQILQEKKICELLKTRIKNIFLEIVKMQMMLYENENAISKMKLSFEKMNINEELQNNVYENIAYLIQLKEGSLKIFNNLLMEFSYLLSSLANIIAGEDFAAAEKVFFADDFGKNIEFYFNFLKKVHHDSCFANISNVKTQIKLILLISNPLKYSDLLLVDWNPKYSNLYSIVNDNNKAIVVIIEYLKNNIENQDISYKVINALCRIFKQRNIEMHNLLANELINIISNNLLDTSVMAYLNKEILRMLCILTSFTDSTVLWIKMDSHCLHYDYSNYSDVMVKHDFDNRSILLLSNYEKSKRKVTSDVKSLPYKKVRYKCFIII